MIWGNDEWFIDDGWFDEADKHYMYTLRKRNGYERAKCVPEEELRSADEQYNESKKRENMKFKRIAKEAGKYPMWWIRFCDSRNKLGQAAEDM